MLIAEVTSRISDENTFMRGLKILGFAGSQLTKPSTHFVLIRTRKMAQDKAKGDGDILGLAPCIYKRR